MKLLITDLDNTLYDWVTYFAHSFYAMVAKLTVILDMPVDQLLNEFRAVHQQYKNSEHPFAVFEIATVRERYGNLSRAELKTVFDDALHDFNKQRIAHLRLYPGVLETLQALKAKGVTVVAHTEAIAENAYFRLRFLQIVEHFQHLYALEGQVEAHPVPAREQLLAPPSEFVQIVRYSERKPNPSLLLNICAKQDVAPADAVYVGDSLTRDVSMAKAAGVKAVWARYGLNYDRELWNSLVRVTHWTTEDVQREEDLKKQFAKTEPDIVIDAFSDLLHVVPV